MSPSDLPVLPHGSPTTLRSLSETFSFHSSPETFVTSRVLAFQSSHPSLANSRLPIRAKVLNRNVAVISSYHHVREILCENAEDSGFSAGEAYDELMAPFFPPPNLLLADPPVHAAMKAAWEARIASMREEVRPTVHDIVLGYFRGFTSGVTIDLYESMKELSWRILLVIFLRASEHDAAKLEFLQEDLLRGQFSLFPMSINARVWRTPRSKGLAARKQLQNILKSRVEAGTKGCPFATNGAAERQDVANHLLLFTSSLAVKSLASLLTALLLNIHILEKDGKNLASRLRSLPNESDRDRLLQSVFKETERLSPPVIGIMRRTTRDVILTSGQEHTNDTLLPKSWDAWLYFVGAARDPAAFGSTAGLFQPERYNHSSPELESVKEGLAFGAGPKTCLGKELIGDVITTTVKTCLGIPSERTTSQATIEFQCSINDIPRGVQGWLGWQQDIKPEEWARDMKQLPTQRPNKAVRVQLLHDLAESQV